MTAIRNRRYLESRVGGEAVFTRSIIPRPARGFHRDSRDSRENPELARRQACATIAQVAKRVLIVDDHEPFRAVARELLEGAGYIVAGEAADAAEALAAVAVGRA